MDNHPIPQDITGFQFRLIGNMTVKQFIYLAVGTIFAWLFFFVLPLPALIRWPIAIFAISLGGSLAFVPIDGRPMDQMFVNLMRAIFAPTQYVYDKTGGILPPPLPIEIAKTPPPLPQPQPTQQIDQNNIATGTANQQQVTSASLPVQPVQPVQVASQPAPTVPSTQAPISPPVNFDLQSPSTSPSPVSLGWQIDGNGDGDDKGNKKYVEENNKLIKNEVKLEGEVEELKKELDEAKTEEKLSLGSVESGQSHEKAEQLSKMLEQTIAQKVELEKELAMLKANLDGSPKTQTYSPSVATAPPPTLNVRQVPKGLEKATGVIATPEEPNLIVGIIKDPRGNPLQNILVEVKDLEDNPVRAFKTNALGQFASATSLSNGKYVITFDDTRGQHRFDSVQIEANGGIILPLEIFSIDQREELRRELFN